MRFLSDMAPKSYTTRGRFYREALKPNYILS